MRKTLLNDEAMGLLDKCIDGISKDHDYGAAELIDGNTGSNYPFVGEDKFIFGHVENNDFHSELDSTLLLSVDPIIDPDENNQITATQENCVETIEQDSILESINFMPTIDDPDKDKRFSSGHENCNEANEQENISEFIDVWPTDDFQEKLGPFAFINIGADSEMNSNENIPSELKIILTRVDNRVQKSINKLRKVRKQYNKSNELENKTQVQDCKSQSSKRHNLRLKRLDQEKSGSESHLQGNNNKSPEQSLNKKVFENSTEYKNKPIEEVEKLIDKHELEEVERKLMELREFMKRSKLQRRQHLCMKNHRKENERRYKREIRQLRCEEFLAAERQRLVEYRRRKKQESVEKKLKNQEKKNMKCKIDPVVRKRRIDLRKQWREKMKKRTDFDFLESERLRQQLYRKKLKFLQQESKNSLN